MTTTGDATPRFEFGENWRRFLTHVDERRVGEAERSVRELVKDVAGRTVLDLGCGSGLFSLAFVRLGAARVVSIDYDGESVAATQTLRSRFAPDDERWAILRGDATDVDQMGALGTFDIVYSWGVLHHTGAMWTAIANACAAVAPDGTLVLSIYNDQGVTSRLWTRVKRTYQRLPRPLKAIYVGLVMAPREARFLLAATARRNPVEYVHGWTRYAEQRGMSRWHDLVDWVGGYPFEVARPEEVFEFCRERGFELEALRTCAGGLGCNEFRFHRNDR